MVDTILPIVHGERIRGGVGLAQWTFAIGCIAGGAALGSALGMIGGALGLRHVIPSWGPVMLAIAGAIHLMFAARELGLIQFVMPQSRWQVPRAWQFTMAPRMAGFLYGAGLGFGIFTRITTGALYLVMAWIVLLGDIGIGAAVLAVFGAGRALPVVLLAAAAPGKMSGWGTLLESWQLVGGLLNGLALGASGAWLMMIARKG
jgi:hypothetical protein